jgi:hypothetical protein
LEAAVVIGGEFFELGGIFSGDDHGFGVNAERFGLKLHFEKRELPVLAMVLAKPGKPVP